MRWNIFDAGRIRNNIVLQDALTEEFLASYEQTVLSAVEEVETAMAAYVQEVQRREALQRSVVAARASVDLVDTLYRSGLTDFQNVLDTQRSQFTQEDALAESQGPGHPEPDPALPGAGRRLGPSARGRLGAGGDRHPAGTRAPAGRRRGRRCSIPRAAPERTPRWRRCRGRYGPRAGDPSARFVARVSGAAWSGGAISVLLTGMIASSV